MLTILYWPGTFYWPEYIFLDIRTIDILLCGECLWLTNSRSCMWTKYTSCLTACQPLHNLATKSCFSRHEDVRIWLVLSNGWCSELWRLYGIEHAKSRVHVLLINTAGHVLSKAKTEQCRRNDHCKFNVVVVAAAHPPTPNQSIQCLRQKIYIFRLDVNITFITSVND